MLTFDYDKFSRDVKRAMKRKFKSYRTLSVLCGIPHATIHRYVKRPDKMSLKDFAIICHALDLSLYDFIDDDWQQKEMFR